MRKIATVACAFLVAGSVAQARADVLYNFSFTTQASDAGNLVFTAPDNSVRPTLTAISGTYDNMTVTGISTYAGADNILFTDNPAVPFDFPGISFSTATNSFNLFDDGSTRGQRISFNSDPNGYPNTGDFTEITSSSLTRQSTAGASVPEPSTLALIAAGLAATAFVARRRNTRSN